MNEKITHYNWRPFHLFHAAKVIDLHGLGQYSFVQLIFPIAKNSLFYKKISKKKKKKKSE